MIETNPEIYWLQCPEGQDKRRVQLIRDGDLPEFVRVRDVDTGEILTVSKNRLQLPLPLGDVRPSGSTLKEGA